MPPRDASSGASVPDETTPPRGGRWLWIPIVALALVTLELTSRVEDRIAYGMPFLSRITASADLVMRDTIGARGRPNTVFRRWRLDSLGFRGPEVSPIAAPGTLRVVTTGASETFGLYESAGQEFPRQLEDSLRSGLAAACGRDAAPVEVINAALPGMALPSLARHLERFVAPLRPTTVVVYPSPGFYLNDRAPQAAEGLRADTTLPSRKALELRFVGRLTTQLKSLAPDWALTWSRQRVTRFTARRFPDNWRYTSVPTDRLDQFELDLRATVGTVKSFGATPVLMGYVNATMAPGFDDPAMLVAWEYQFPRAQRDVIPAFHALAAGRIARVARDSGVMFVDLRRGFEGHWNGAFADFVHFTDAGSATVAATLSQALLHGAARGPACRDRQS